MQDRKNEEIPGYVPLSSHRPNSRDNSRRRKAQPPHHENLSMDERIKKLNKSFGSGSKNRGPQNGTGQEG